MLRSRAFALSLTLLTGSVAWGGVAWAGAAPPIQDKPIRFGKHRKQLTLSYRRLHQDPAAQKIEIVPRMIVVHHTGGSSFRAAWRHLDRVEIDPRRRRLARHGRVNVSAHFLVDRQGRIYRLMPENWFARHCIGLNHVAIGIENVGGVRGAPLTRAQLQANAALVRYLADKHDITHLIGHHEYRAFERHPYFSERVAGYRSSKRDPGRPFMRQLRRRLADLHLSGVPAHATR